MNSHQINLPGIITPAIASKRFYITLFLLVFAGTVSAQQTKGTVKAILNGLEFVFDNESGGILSMSYPATGNIIKTKADSAGLVEVAYPVKEVEPMRLATRFSRNAKITKGNGSVTIYWDELGSSRSFVKYKGKVSATVTLKEDADGKSVSMSCTINNQSELPVPQVIFPDFFGIVPFNGVKGTEFRTGGTVMKPFIDLKVDDHDYFFAANKSSRWFHYGFVLDGKNLVIRWMDIGGRKGGLSIFSKNWGYNRGYNEGVLLKLSESNGRLRYLNTVSEEIPAGSSWTSDEFIITPHANGWAQGIIPYRNWADQNIKRLYPLPDHVRDGLGFRTLWMRFSFYPEDANGTYFTFKDLPKAAKEAKENGLDEMSLWGWADDCFTLPLPPPSRFLGSEQDMLNAFAECKKIGVNVSPFISVMTASPATAKKYGLTPNAEYNIDIDFIPQSNPRYAKRQKGAAIVPSSNKLWQEEALSSVKRLIEIGVPSMGWDQYFTVGPGKYLDTLVTKIRKIAKQKDPQSTFAGEVGTNMENECDLLDYSWNWDYNDNCDYRAVISSLKGPRINQNIDRSPAEVKYFFADNIYLNVYPRKRDSVNGTDYISNHPKLSAALKQCARLRKQFLNYFVNGTFIADCVLSADCPDAHVSAYTLPKSMLVIVINKGNKKTISFESDIHPWLPSSTGRYKIKTFNDGKFLATATINSAKWKQKTPLMNNLDIVMYEVSAE